MIIPRVRARATKCEHSREKREEEEKRRYGIRSRNVALGRSELFYLRNNLDVHSGEASHQSTPRSSLVSRRNI